MTRLDIAYIGHYTQDTIIYPEATRTVDGGAFYYGCNVIARMGLRAGVITRLAQQDWHVVRELEQLGVQVFAHATPASTCLRLSYPTTNLDQRTIEITSSAGPFTVSEVAQVNAQAFIIGASVRGEVPTKVVAALAAKGALIALDVQGYIRVAKDGKLTFGDWPDKEEVLQYVTVLKTDLVEATGLTGESNPYAALRQLAQWGPREILMTQSEQVLLHHDGIIETVPLVPRALKGRSGRGDTCTAAFLSKRLTSPPAEAVTWAAAVTSLKLETEGPFRGTLPEVEMLYEKLTQARRTWQNNPDT